MICPKFHRRHKLAVFIIPIFRYDTGVSRADETAPTLTVFSVSPLQVKTDGKITVTANATDGDSGVESVKARFVDKTTGRGLSVSLVQQEDGSWKEVLSSSQTKLAGTYELEKVMVKDHAGNRTVLLPGQSVLPEACSFVIFEDETAVVGLPFTDVSEGAY